MFTLIITCGLVLFLTSWLKASDFNIEARIANNSNSTNFLTNILDTCDLQMPGDVNGDGSVNVSDITYLTAYLIGGGPAPNPPANGDVDGDCDMDFDDIDYLSNYLNSGGPPPVDCTCLSPDTCSFQMAGDIDGDGLITVVDIVYLLNYLNGGPSPSIPANADVNGDCQINYDDFQAIELYITIWDPNLLIDCTCLFPMLDSCLFQSPGDANSDGTINVSDITYLVTYLYSGGSAPNPLANGDADGDCDIDGDDIQYLSDYLISGGPLPVDCTCQFPDTCSYQTPGDANSDGAIDIADITFLVNFLNASGQAPVPLANGDPNGDCKIDNNDIQYLSDYLNSGGPPPVDCSCMYPEVDSCLVQKPGDFNSDGSFDIDDLTFMTAYFHLSGPAPVPLANGDANGDCRINVGDSKHLAEYLFSIPSGPPPVDCTCQSPDLTVCCYGIRGNVDYDPIDAIDIADIVYLVEYMFGTPTGPAPLCPEEANIDGKDELNISDLVYLVEYQFNDPPGPPPVPCE